jgi:membrane fusion protein (multidrug efflux system)
MSDNNTQTTAAPSSAAVPEAGNGKRRRALTALTVAVVVVGGGWGLYEWLVASHYEDTDNAYVQGNVIQITPQIGGTVMAINADDTDYVKAGQPLVQLDPADAKVALEQAEAALAQTVRQTRTLYANNGSLAAQVTLRQSDIVKAQSDIAKAQDDLQRRRALSGNGAVSKEELNHAETTLANAKSALAAAQAGVIAAREQLASNQSLTEGTSVAEHPSVLAAAAKVREAYLATQRVAMPAPVDGYVAKRTVQLGQRVAAGTPMMSIVPLNQLWVDANFKEVQAAQHPHRPAGEAHRRRLRQEGRVHGQGRRPGRGHRQRLRAAARAERHRQLDQGGATRAGAHRAGRRAAQGQPAAHRPVDGRRGRHHAEGRQDARRCAARHRAHADAGLQPARPRRRCRGRPHRGRQPRQQPGREGGARALGAGESRRARDVAGLGRADPRAGPTGLIATALPLRPLSLHTSR